MHQIIQLDEQPESLREFFANLGDRPVLVKLQGKAVAVVYPAIQPVIAAAGPEKLQELAGAWDSLPDDVERIGG